MRTIPVAVALCVACGSGLPELPECPDMISPHSIKRFPGLFGSANPFDLPPEGAAEIEQDTVRRSRNIAEPRRGFKASPAAGGPINAIAFKQGQVVALTYNTPGNAGALRLYNPATNAWSALPLSPGGALGIDRPSGAASYSTTFVSANKALYFQSRYGLTKIEDIASGVCRPAIQPANITNSTNNGMGSWIGTLGGGPVGWLGAGNQVAYRFTTCRKGANGELIESAPSERVLASNTSGAAIYPTIHVWNSFMVPPDGFYRVYRSRQVANGVDPQDEMFLIYELAQTPAVNPINADGYYVSGSGNLLSPIDVAGDTSLYVPLYTNPSSGLTIAQANSPAQLSADIAWFKNRLYTLNTTDVQRLTVKVVGTGSSGGIQAGDTFSVSGVTFTFVSAPSPTRFNTPGLFVGLYTAGTAAQNIENTARDMAAAINTYFSGVYPTTDSGPLSNKIMAIYISGTSTDAGQVLLQRVVPGAQSFTFTTSSNVGFGSNYTGGATSSPNAQVAGLSWSALGQPESNPTANNTPIGDQSAAGQRLIALRDTLFAFKADGLWKITDDGSALGPIVQLVDPTIRLVAPRSAVALDNMIFALVDQGMVMITETGGVTNISHLQIERELFKLMAQVGFANLASLAFGVAYLPEHTYILCLPESQNATSCTKQYVYNLQSQAWTSWNIPGGVLSGAVHPDTGQLYFGRSDGTLCIERKDFASTDYQDPGFTISSPTAAQTASLVFTGDLRSGSTPFAVGDVVQQWQSVKALQQRVTAVTYSSAANQTTVTLDNTPRYAWDQIAPLTIVKAIQAQMKFIPFHAGEPLTDKDWGDCFLSFRYCDLDFLNVGWATELYPFTNTKAERINNADGSAAPITLDAWGSKPWGSVPWGRQARDIALKATMPQEISSSAQLTLTLGMPCALCRFELSALDIKITGVTPRPVR